MTILINSICNKICERYERYGDKHTLVHASKHQEPAATIASIDQAGAYTHFQAADESAYSLVCQALVCAVPLIRYRDHNLVHQMVGGSDVRRHERGTEILIALPV